MHILNPRSRFIGFKTLAVCVLTNRPGDSENHSSTVIWLGFLMEKCLMSVSNLLPRGPLSRKVKCLGVEWAGELGWGHDIDKKTYT